MSTATVPVRQRLQQAPSVYHDRHGWPIVRSEYEGRGYVVYVGPDWLDHALAEQAERLGDHA
jgi:hypothetical protein